MKDVNVKPTQKNVKALKKVIDPAKAVVAAKENGGSWAIGIAFAFAVPRK